MRFILDTNVVSALRVRGRHLTVEAWAAAHSVADLYITAMTVAELERGVIAKERGDAAQGLILRRWFEDHVIPSFSGRVLPFDLPAARILATFRVPERAPLDDALIGAVAQAAEMTVATRNTRHFQPLGVRCLNPWEQGT